MQNDNIQSSTTRWDETMIAMKMQFDEEILEFFANMLQFFEGDCSKGNDCDYCIHLCVLFIKKGVANVDPGVRV